MTRDCASRPGLERSERRNPGLRRWAACARRPCHQRVQFTPYPRSEPRLVAPPHRPPPDATPHTRPVHHGRLQQRDGQRLHKLLAGLGRYNGCAHVGTARTRLTGRQFISSRGNEYFCEIDEEYLTDRFNLTGLNTEVQYYQYALDLVTDVFDFDCDDDMREQIEKSARHLYGLVHARYVVTTRGLAKMVRPTPLPSSPTNASFFCPLPCRRQLTYPLQLEKFKKSDFGKCPRVMCESQPLLPMGQSDVPNTSPVKLYCARCEDLYNPKSSRHAIVDGAYFGTSFHNIIFQVYPAMLPPKSQRRFEPRVFGFKVHAAAALSRWQADQRDQMKDRLKALKMETGFEEEDEEDEEEEEEEEDMELQPGVEGAAVQV